MIASTTDSGIHEVEISQTYTLILLLRFCQSISVVHRRSSNKASPVDKHHVTSSSLTLFFSLRPRPNHCLPQYAVVGGCADV